MTVVRLYLVQHAESKSKEEDPERPLSDKGLKDIAKMARYATHHLSIEVERVAHSGKLRAKQTAEILAEHLARPKEVMANDDLEPLADPKVWQRRLAETIEDTLLVGHLPHLSKLASTLLVRDENREVVSFKMGAIVCLERDQQNHWTIQWMITPDTIP